MRTTWISSGRFPALSATTIRQRRRPTSVSPTPESEKLIPVSDKNRTIDLWSPFVVATTGSSTEPVSVNGGGRLTRFLWRWRSFRFPAITSRAPRSYRRHYGFNSDW